MVDNTRDRIGDEFDEAKDRTTDAARAGRDAFDDTIASGERDFMGRVDETGDADESGIIDKVKEKVKDITND